MRRSERARIGLEVSGLLARCPSGIGVYGRRLVEALGSAGEREFEFLLLHPWRRRRRRKYLPPWDLRARSYFGGKRLRSTVSLLHTLDTRLPAAYDGPLVATIYDVLSALAVTREKHLAPPRFQRKKLAAYARIIARADCIITVSEATRTALRDHLAARGRVEVVYPGVDPPDWREGSSTALPRLSAFGIRRPYLLSVGALCPRKNLGAAVQAFRAARALRPDLQLVLAGESSFGWEGSPDESAVRSLGESAVVTGYLPRDVLWEAYRQASALLYLSHYEGFGLPVVEALAAGTAVVASRRGGIPEAAGDVAELVDPDDAAAVAAATLRVLAADAGAEEFAVQRREHAARFRWDRAAERVLAIYRDVLRGARSVGEES